MKNREHVAKILTREVTIKERHNAIHNLPLDDAILTREALLWLADRVDELEAFKFGHKKLHNLY